MRRTRYTLNEDKIIIKCIHSSNLNIDLGCEEASKVINRTHKSVLNRYYHNIRKKNPNILASIGGQNAVNTKNVARGRKIPEGLSISMNGVFTHNSTITQLSIHF